MIPALLRRPPLPMFVETRIERARLRACIQAMADRMPWSDVMAAINDEVLSVAAERRAEGDLPEGWVA